MLCLRTADGYWDVWKQMCTVYRNMPECITSSSWTCIHSRIMQNRVMYIYSLYVKTKGVYVVSSFRCSVNECVCVLAVKRSGQSHLQVLSQWMVFLSVCRRSEQRNHCAVRRLFIECSAAFGELCNCHGNRPISRPYGRPPQSQTDPVQSQRQKASRAPRVYNQLVINVLKLAILLSDYRARPARAAFDLSFSPRQLEHNKDV